jgi:hypothetical protein
MVIEELRSELLRNRLAKAKEDFAQAKSRMVFWCVVFAVSGCLMVFFQVAHFEQKYLRAVQAGLDLLTAFSFCVGFLAVMRFRKAKAAVEDCQTMVAR